MSRRTRVRPPIVGLFTAIAISVLLGAAPVFAAPPQSGPCNGGQFNDNSWVVRDTPIATSPNWVTWVQGDITPYGYELCTHPDYDPPDASGTGAWVAIEPNQQGSSIIQIGYWKCGAGFVACGNGMRVGELDYFYAWGIQGDILHQPWPTYISGPVAISGSHTFKVLLYYPGDGTREWRFYIGGSIAKVLDDNWRTWPREKAQIGTEVWNCGDQMGGRDAFGTDAGNKQKFRNISWRAGTTTHFGDLGDSYRSGNPYAWAGKQNVGDAGFDVWTSAHTTSFCPA